MESRELFARWLEKAVEDADVAAELAALKESGDEGGVRFYRELEFGTGGLRGVIGAGSNRMNIYNIRKATQGLANYLNSTELPKQAAIGYDSRIKSDVFARETARVLAANGITAWLYPRLEPTPALSWAAARVCASLPATTPPSTTATRSTARTAARSLWRQPGRSRPR